MKKTVLIARANMRRAKGQTAAITVLILVAAAMLNLWLMLSMDYRQNFDRCHDRLNAEHVTLVLNGEADGLTDFVAKTLDADARTDQYTMEDCMSMVGSIACNGGEINSEFVILNRQTAENRRIGKAEITEDSEYTSGVYLPMLYRSEDSLTAGSEVDITIGSHTGRYTVCGFLNSAMLGSHNCYMCTLIFTDDKYEELEEIGCAPKSTLVSVRIRNLSENEDFEAALKNAVSSQFPQIRTVSNSYSLVSSSRYISQMICSGIVSAMAFFVALIALVVIASNVINYVQENMKNLGALMAIGYRSRQIIAVLLLQFCGIAVIAAAAGIALSYGLFPSVNAMMIAQTGIPYSPHFLPVPSVLTLLLIVGSVALAVWLSARRIRRIEPILALRQGVQTHSFKRNHVPLENTRAPLNLALALKTTLSGIRQNVIVCTTMLVLSLVVVFSGLMVENVIVNMDPFINLIVGETADSCISVSIEDEERFLETTAADPRVEKAYLYNSIEVRHVGAVALTATLSDDFTEVNNPNVCIEGRFPKYENEIAVAAKYAGDHNIRIGDEITMTADGNEADYLVCGFTQISNNLGKDCLLTREGYLRMGELSNVNYYLNLTDGTDIDAFNDDVGRRFDMNASINIHSVLEASATVYVTLMTIIVFAILILSVIIIAFVLYLLVRTMLANKKRDYGILKAIGFTTGQLILQTAASFMPAVILSTAAGLVINSLIINPLTALFLNGIGIVRCTFTVPVGFIAAAGAGLVALAFGIACLLSLRIRSIAPRTLLSEE